MDTIEFARLEAKHTNNAIKVLSAAFLGDPLMNFFFGDAYEHSAKHLWQYVCDVTPILNWLLLGAFVEGELLGVAFVTPPEKAKDDVESAMRFAPRSERIATLEERLVTAVGEKAAMRMDAYLSLKNTNKPPQPHFYVNTLGVHPQNQRKGIGSALLLQLQAISEEHPHSCGVALDTEKEKNVTFYKRFGYRVSRTANLDNVKIWFMFQTNKFNFKPRNSFVES